MNRRGALKALAGMVSVAGPLATSVDLESLLPEGKSEFTLTELEENVWNCGIFSEANGGKLLARHTFKPSVLKKAMENLEITYTLKLGE